MVSWVGTSGASIHVGEGQNLVLDVITQGKQTE